MEREETGSLEGWRDGNRRDPPGGMEGNRRERVPGGMETEETGSLEECKHNRQGAWRHGNRIDRKPRGMET